MNRYFVLLLALFPFAGLAQETDQSTASPTPFVLPTATPPPAPQPVAVKLTAQDLEPFLDGLMNVELARRNIAGGVVTVVKDGQVLLCKGFGYSDFARRQTVVPDRTLFRPGSITKLFTAIAVMQLVEVAKSTWIGTLMTTWISRSQPRSFSRSRCGTCSPTRQVLICGFEISL